MWMERDVKFVTVLVHYKLFPFMGGNSHRTQIQSYQGQSESTLHGKSKAVKPVEGQREGVQIVLGAIQPSWKETVNVYLLFVLTGFLNKRTNAIKKLGACCAVPLLSLHCWSWAPLPAFLQDSRVHGGGSALQPASAGQKEPASLKTLRWAGTWRGGHRNRYKALLWVPRLRTGF